MIPVWLKCRQCRQCRPAFISSPFEPSCAVRQCRKKSSTIYVTFGQEVRMFHRPFHFVRDAQELKTRLFPLKQSPCPHCGCRGALNRHSRSLGNDPNAADGQTCRGQRVFCSNRGQRGGCGRTFSFFLAEVLPRHTVTASLVWPWLVKLLAGLSVKAAVETLRLPFALETFYRLRRRLRQRLDLLRAQLCRAQTPPVGTHTDPLLQTVEHLKVVLPGGACPPADYQLQFQQPFLG